MQIIGISGKKWAGKDTLCTHILEALPERGVRRAFADRLKEEVSIFLYPTLKEKGHTLKQIREMLDDPKTKEQFRLLMQWYGTEYRRNLFGEDYWLRMVDKWIEENQLPDNTILIIPDTRFLSEIEWIKSKGGKIVLIERPCLKNTDTHSSETELDHYKFDSVITNNNKDNLAFQATELLERLGIL